MEETKEFSEAISEVLDIIKHMDEEFVELIPLEFIQKLNAKKSETYKPNIDYTKPLNQNNFKPETKNIMAMIYLDYLCTDDEKEEYMAICKSNEEKHQNELKEKYNTNLFENKVNTNEGSLMKIEEKENIFQKVWKKFFGKKY